VWNSSSTGSSLIRRNTTGSYNVRPVFQLDPTNVVFISEIGGRGIDSISADGNYLQASSGNKNYKLTLLGENNGADVGTLVNIPTRTVMVTKDTEIHELTGLIAEPSGPGSYTVNYTIVKKEGNNRVIISYGSSSTSDLTSVNIDKSLLTLGEEYTVQVWLQRNNDLYSHEATRPQSFTLRVWDGRVVGDVNGNGEVTAVDALLLAQFLGKHPGVIVGDNFNIDLADIDGDGRVTLRDLAILQRYLARWEGYDRYFYLKYDDMPPPDVDPD